MRIWSLHSKYLDSKGLIALWRESLLAQKVLMGKTKGYINHPQLLRFKAYKEPINAISYYLSKVYEEGLIRGYNFDNSKIVASISIVKKILVNKGQLEYELEHLRQKLKIRDFKRYELISGIKIIEKHPLFKQVEGDIESWEVR